MTSLKKSERIALSVIFAAVLVLVTSDITSDWKSGSGIGHVSVEGLILIASLVGLIWLWRHSITTLRSDVQQLSQALEVSQAAAQRWQNEHQQLVKGLGEAIDKQLAAWNFTRSEKEIALLLLKGLSLKEVAELRNTSERTVRQQTLAIYEKSGLAGRAELSAFFLEDLMLPVNGPGEPAAEAQGARP